MERLYKISVTFFYGLLVSCAVCAGQETPSGAPSVYVSGIIEGDPPSAIVNGKLVKPGSAVGKMKIISISGDSVAYEYNGETLRKRLGAGALKRNPLAYTGEETPVPPVDSKEQRSAFFAQQVAQLTKSANDNYEKAKEAYGKDNELLALQYYDAALRDAQGAYAYADETQRSRLQKFINTCNAHMSEIKGEPSRVGDLGSYNLENPKKISGWLTTNIAYKTDQKVHDKNDYWQSPEETIMLESGDCEDFAFLAQAFLNEIGISSTVVMIGHKTDRKGHALCIFPRGGVYDCFDGPALLVMGKESIEAIVKELYPDYLIEGRYTAYVSHFIIFDLDLDR